MRYRETCESSVSVGVVGRMVMLGEDRRVGGRAGEVLGREGKNYWLAAGLGREDGREY